MHSTLCSLPPPYQRLASTEGCSREEAVMQRPIRSLLFFAWLQLYGGAAEPLPSAALPMIHLDSQGTIVSDPGVPCRIRWLTPGAPETSDPSRTHTGLVRFHGASSQAYPKKSFKVAFDAPVKWLGMRESAHWVLNAAFVDRSLMRHKLSYDLFRSMSSSNAPRYASASRFVEVTLNGKYHGAYLLMERVDRALLGLRKFDSNATHHACIYKAIDHAANFDRPGHAGYEQREPDPELREYWGPLDRFNKFVSSTTDAQFFAPDKGIATRLDLDNAIDFHLLVLVTSNMDGYDKNLMLARDMPEEGKPLPRFFFVPWDYDATFGRNWEASRVGTSEWLSNHLLDRLLSHADYRRRFASRWKELRAGTLSTERLRETVDENVRTLGDAAQRNAVRWQTLDGPYPDRLTFEEDIDQMKQWINRRLKWLDAEIERRTAVETPAK
ncbi:MAG: hypothetical protein FJ405_12985 [Verrucomicrobia bacterium]|nr:hypothetical protein [Verrucomicrobiota bacterium]